jgi:hypothetical protein
MMLEAVEARFGGSRAPHPVEWLFGRRPMLGAERGLRHQVTGPERGLRHQVTGPERSDTPLKGRPGGLRRVHQPSRPLEEIAYEAIYAILGIATSDVLVQDAAAGGA